MNLWAYVGCFTLVTILINIYKIKERIRKWPNLTIILLTVGATAFLYTYLFILFPFLWTLKKVITLYLKYKHGPKFTGIVDGFDVFHMAKNAKNSTISILLLYKFDHGSSQSAYEAIKNVVDKGLVKPSTKLEKLHSVLHYYFGYGYLLKQEITADECIRKMKVVEPVKRELKQNELITLIEQCHMEPMPRNNKILWDALIGTQPVCLKNSKSSDQFGYYPLLLRVHHCVADGYALVRILAGTWADPCETPENSKKKISLTLYQYLYLTVLNNVIDFFYTFIFSPFYLVNEHFIIQKDSNILHRPMLSDSNLLAFKLDDSGDILQKIRRIKKKIPKTSFSDVLHTAISASLNNYFDKNSTEKPPHLTVAVPYLRESVLISETPIGKLDLSDIEFHNNFKAHTLFLPLTHKKSRLLDRLNYLQKQTVNVKNSVDTKVANYWSHVLLPILPQYVVLKLCACFEWTAIISILPGPPKLVCGKGTLPLDNCMFWIPHLHNVGCNISSFTYDNRLQLGLSVNRSLINDQESANAILNDIHRYLDLFEEELNCT